jgi:Ca2+:H+ antiporter
MRQLTRGERVTLAVALTATLLTFGLRLAGVAEVGIFAVATVALAALAAVVGDAVEQLGGRLGPGATGVLQSALGNLPELFIAVFALRSGLVGVVQAALVGSIMANTLLVLGLAFLVGGVRHGRQRFDSEPPRIIATLMLLAVAALILPTLATVLHTPAARHVEALSIASAVLLLGVFVASIPFSLRSTAAPAPESSGEAASWPMWLTLAVLGVSSVAAAFASDWFVDALRPATEAIGLSQAFTGLVVVAIAGNAVENVVGIELAGRNQADYAVSVILNSPLQIALGLTPILVLLSFLLGTAHLILVLPPLLVAAVALATVLPALIVFDGESIWLEGVALIGLYGVIAAAFWWG